MKLRSLYILSIVGLLLLILVQVGGTIYAYNNTKKEAQRALDECFRLAFIETVDRQINNLPFPDWTIPFYSYILNDSTRAYEDEVFLNYQQAASFLEEEYHVTIPLDEMARLVEKKLKWKNIDRTVLVRPASDRNQQSAYIRFKTVLSRKAWLNEKKGEAIEAVMFSPFMALAKDTLFLFLPTLLLVVFVIYAWAKQMKGIIEQQNTIKEQRSAFYYLAKRMRLPVGEVCRQIPEAKWATIEASGRQLLDMTEQTLIGAKENERQKQVRKQQSYKVFSVIGLIATCLLLVVWFVYLYRMALKETVFQVNDCFESAFYEETFNHRFALFRAQGIEYGQDRPNEYSKSTLAEEQRLFLADKSSDYKINRFFVLHVDNPVDLNYQLRSALIVQSNINESGQNIPLSLQYLDSAFNSRLVSLGIADRSGIRRLAYPLDSTLLQVGYVSTGFSDISSRFIPLKEDSTLCVQGVVKNPYRYVLCSVWYLLLPLCLMFLVILNCIFGQVKVLRIQRRLNQFQKNFTYAMIHDMKSPLNSILMGAHILDSGKLSDKPDKEEKYKQAMTEECEHLLTLSNRVIMLTQLDEGYLQLHKEEVLLRPLLDDLIAKIFLKINKKVEFSTVYHRCETIYADAFCLREVLSNLIDNAIKYSHEEVKIDIICESEKGFTKIKVCDNGLGIPLKDQLRIFNRFERSTAAIRCSKGGVTGFGLGLNFVQQVMLAHKGKVELESEEERFSEFTLYFPIEIKEK